MKKSFMSNIRNFVDSNVRHRIDRVAHNNNEFFSDDLLSVERHFDDIRNVCIEAEKRISTMLQSIQVQQTLGSYTQNVQAGINNISHNISHATTGSTAANISAHNSSTASNISSLNDRRIEDSKSPESSGLTGNTSKDAQIKPAKQESAQQLSSDIQQRHKKLPVVGFLKFLVKSRHKLRADSLLATTLTHCSQLQTQLTNLYLTYEHTIEAKCLKPIQLVLEVDIPNVIKLRKLFIKSHNDLESLKIKYNGASQKQLQQQQSHAGNSTSSSYTISQSNAQQAHVNKLEQLKKELDEAVMKFEQAKDTYEVELYAFVCRETELVDLLRVFYQFQAEYHQQVLTSIQNSLPDLNQTLAHTPRKAVFGTRLDEHLRCTGRIISPVIEICTHLLHNQGLNEEGLFRVPGSSIKIKKLKNSINAWFISLASRSELDNDQKRQIGHSCVIAIHDLFKRFVGFDNNQDDTQSNISDDSTLTPRRDSQLVFDIHSIAGLLKLYLRELPEPLFTFELYDKWVDVVSSRYSTNEEQVEAFGEVLQQLPKANYENMRHLLRFLQMITCHQDRNKMSSTNLAITMAPSLIWPKPVEKKSTDTADQIQAEISEDAQSTIAQMSSIGMSTSQHAMVVETLINNAERLLPGQVDFNLPGFENLTLLANSGPSKQPDRSVKSTSPTGLSTTSSSSVSSNASNSASIKLKTHSRKGGSMDGLLNHDHPTSPDSGKLINQTSKMNAPARPMSVHIQRDELTSPSFRRQNPPPVPPVPTTRCHPKTTAYTVTRSKPMAPPVPQLSLSKPNPTNDSDCKPRAHSLRGTGSVPLATSPSINQTGVSMRPTVPPPERPSDKPLSKTSTDATLDVSISENPDRASPDNKLLGSRSDEGDNKSAHSLTSSSNLKADFEEISAAEVEDIDISAPESPVVSIDDNLSDDSSFDNDTHPSLEYSWNKSKAIADTKEPGLKQSSVREDRVTCPVKEDLVGQISEISMQTTSSVIVDKNIKQSQKTHIVEPKREFTDSAEEARKMSTNNNRPMGPEQRPPPVKPPRSISPKISQSTPL